MVNKPLMAPMMALMRRVSASRENAFVITCITRTAIKMPGNPDVQGALGNI